LFGLKLLHCKRSVTRQVQHHGAKPKSLSILPAFSDNWHTSNTSELQYEKCHSERNHHSSAIIIVKTLVIFLSFTEAVGLLLHLSSSSDSSPFLN